MSRVVNPAGSPARGLALVLGLLLITSLLLAGTALAVPTRARAASTKTITMADLTSEALIPTGINLSAGESASMAVTGDGKCGSGSDCPTGDSAGGTTCGARTLGALEPGPAGPDIPYGAVAARIGGGAFFVAGPSSKATGPGELQLLYADCAGYYDDNTGSYTVTVTYTGETAEEEAAKHAGAGSFTAVQCTISTVAPSSSTCTAQVAGFGLHTLVSPTGTVSFTAKSGTVASSCTLVATAGSPGISSCTVSYLPAASLTPGTPPPVLGHYSGDSHFGPSEGESSFTPRSVVLFEDLVDAEATAAADSQSSEGIPVVLTNTNPFAVSADEELTVSGYPSVANSSSISTAQAARVQRIGRVTVKLGPLKTVRTKVKLSAGGARLLKSRHKLSAMLVVTTKVNGKPSRTVRHKLKLKH